MPRDMPHVTLLTSSQLSTEALRPDRQSDLDYEGALFYVYGPSSCRCAPNPTKLVEYKHVAASAAGIDRAAPVACSCADLRASGPDVWPGRIRMSLDLTTESAQNAVRCLAIPTSGLVDVPVRG